MTADESAATGGEKRIRWKVAHDTFLFRHHDDPKPAGRLTQKGQPRIEAPAAGAGGLQNPFRYWIPPTIITAATERRIEMIFSFRVTV